MIIYNVTINIDKSAHEEWLQWMLQKHIPDMLATKKFSEAKMCKVLVEEDMGGITYSVQYRTKDRPTLEAYYRDDAPKMRSEGMAKFADKFVAFRTELEIVSEQNS
ncbi:DUF4286 family protein [uncultured Croceitalea sp.]|uniref:DUF4286 family protein n=1 Tax=uncultured Croceitalea sp. TaxID=1798908 RepID=UPI003305F982